MHLTPFRFLPSAALAAGLCGAGAVWAQPAVEGAGMAQLKVLQSIESGLWQVSTRTEPAPKSGSAQSAPEQGCLSSQDVAEDLQTFLAPEDGMSCRGLLQTNTDELAVLQVICPTSAQPARHKPSVEQSLFKAPPSVIEVRRFSASHFQVISKTVVPKSTGRKSSAEFTAVQDYERLDDCPW
ncbi:MAG: hypothetical protein LBJ15_10960 [Comamonas sp.]|jgi:hypothetical protein|uniref:hypothetical protein n=1 Tax=Comamonas sp. TaxID=34028 RepID=UPI00282E1172|nr:hypothetical protein [Comamonas sp.]MDR0214510.1 hypothetical protein [Comamonas sp.]